MSTMWTKPFISVSLANFFTFFGFQIIMPILPLHLDTWNISSLQVGLVMAGFSLAVLIARPLTALWLDRGFDKICVVLGTLVCLLAIGGYGFSASLALIACSRMLHGAGFGTSSVAYGAIVARLVPASRRAEGMGYFGLSISLAICLGPMAGTYGMEYLGFHNTLLFAGFFTVFGLLWLIMLPKSPPPSEQTVKVKFSWRHFYERSVLLPCILVCLLGVTYGAIVAYVTLWAKELGILNAGFFFLLNAACSLVVRLFTGRIADTMGYAYILLPAALLQFLCMILLMLAKDSTWFVGAGILLGLGLGSAYPILQAWTVEWASLERRSAALAFFYNAYDVGIGGGIILFGWLATIFGYNGMYGISSLSMVVFLVGYACYLIRKRRQKRLAR